MRLEMNVYLQIEQCYMRTTDSFSLLWNHSIWSAIARTIATYMQK